MSDDPDDSKVVKESPRVRALRHLYYSYLQFTESVEAIRDLALHSHTSEGVNIPRKAVFREAVRKWNTDDSEEIIDEIYSQLIRRVAQEAEELLARVEQGDLENIPSGPMAMVQPILASLVEELSQCDAGPWNWDIAWRKTIDRKSRKEALFSSLLVSAASAFEIQVGDAIRCHLRAIPQAVESSEKQYSYADVAKFCNLEAFKNASIEDRVESVMRKDVSSWFDWTNKKFGVNISDVSGYGDEIVEAFLRRNLIVHNGGVVNDIYLSKTPRKVARNDDFKIVVDQQYVLSVIDWLQAAGTALVVRVFDKLGSADESSAVIQDGLLTEVSYELLLAKRYGAVIDLADCVQGCAKAADTALILKVNRWIALKETGKLESIRSDISNWDVSAASMRFVLAKHALLDEHDEAESILKTLLSTRQLSQSHWQTWPLLENLRRYVKEKELKSASATCASGGNALTSTRCGDDEEEVVGTVAD
ncbi:hypothetical protein [Nocardia sp. NPDC057455]|uniref:hypothetical protein n=1 Tax=Nocardia sp. NPDC057455 TaxID=3346138 RepID=UPI00366A9F8F